MLVVIVRGSGEHTKTYSIRMSWIKNSDSVLQQQRPKLLQEGCLSNSKTSSGLLYTMRLKSESITSLHLIEPLDTTSCLDEGAHWLVG